MNPPDIEVWGIVIDGPDMRHTLSHQPVTILEVATCNSFPFPRAQAATEDSYIVTAWEPLAAPTNQLHKGDRVYVEGRLCSDAWKATDRPRRP